VSTGLFHNRASTAQGIGARAHQRTLRAQRSGNLDAFAEALSRHGDVAQAAADVGVSAGSGATYLSRIRKRLGPQAV
jgi:hypothetical protein